MKGREQRQAKGKRAKVVSNERMRRERERGKGGRRRRKTYGRREIALQRDSIGGEIARATIQSNIFSTNYSTKQNHTKSSTISIVELVHLIGTKYQKSVRKSITWK